jgi:hypothetical protein
MGLYKAKAEGRDPVLFADAPITALPMSSIPPDG